MNFLVDTSHRSSKTEIMDDFTLEGVLLRDTLDKLETINRLLGGNSCLLYTSPSPRDLSTSRMPASA